MTSLYIHIPFCQKKCGYCSFPVIPIEKLQSPAGMADQYKTALFRDIAYWSNTMRQGQNDKKQLKTIYFGGGTPLLLGAQYLIDIIQEVEKYFDLLTLEELTFECNPYPYTQTLDTVKTLATTYNHIPRVRFSFGIQSLDDAILQQSHRDYTFVGLQQFTQDLIAMKQPHMLYNYDFIAFGDMDHPSSKHTEQWLQNLITSKTIDSFSLYTLELFPGAKRYHETKDPLISYHAPWDHALPFTASEDSIYNEFDTIKHLFLKGGYRRYEISNYALPGKESLHNHVYWTMGEYIGIGLGAHGFIVGNTNAIPGNSYRTENTGGWKQYISSTPESIYKQIPSTDKDFLIESFFLGLRTMGGIPHIHEYSTILTSTRENNIQNLVKNGLATCQNSHFCLTDAGMSVHHQVCTYLLQDI